jgi:hypothetical protein
MPINKDINFLCHTINELLMPFVILRNLRNSILAKKIGWRYLAFAQFFFESNHQLNEESK